MSYSPTPLDADILAHYETSKKNYITAVRHLAPKLKPDDLKHYASFHHACQALNCAITMIREIKKAHPEWEKS